METGTKTKTKKIIAIIAGAMFIFAAGFSTACLISKIKYTNATDRIECLLGDGFNKSAGLYEQLEQRLKELDEYRKQADTIEQSITECSELANQSGFAIGQLRSTVEKLGTTSSSIGDTLKQLREGQQAIKQYVGQLEENNLRFKAEFGRLQEGFKFEQK